MLLILRDGLETGVFFSPETRAWAKDGLALEDIVSVVLFLPSSSLTGVLSGTKLLAFGLRGLRGDGKGGEDAMERKLWRCSGLMSAGLGGNEIESADTIQ